MKPERALNIADLHRAARRRVPQVVFNYFEGGVEDEQGLARNTQAFQRERLLPRYLVDVSRVELGTALFGRSHAAPFGIAPFGVAGLLRPGAELLMAEAAAAADIPYAMSGLGNTRLEDAARVAPQHTWYQLYGANDRRISEDQIRRAAEAGIPVLLFTVDVPVVSKRERELRSRFGQHPLPLWAYLEALRHPAWLLQYLRHGPPVFENWAPYSAGGRSAKAILSLLQQQFPVANHTWSDVENFRRLWPGKLVLKGILHPDDAARAAELGVDGVIVSNHGGRQLDRAPSPLEVLPAIRAAVGPRLALLLDSGVRRGADVVIAKALGADFVLAGRPFAYGLAAFGRPGVERAIAILRQEIELTLKQIGCLSVDQLGPQHLLREGSAPLATQQTAR